MAPDHSFRDLVRRVRGGDEAAAAELVRHYGETLRRAVRARLTDPELGRLLDSMDICQSVLASFFVRAAAGQYDLDSPGQLVRLLAAMARHKLLRQVGRLRADRRGGRCPQGDVDLPDPGPDPPGVGRAGVAAAVAQPARRCPGRAAAWPAALVPGCRSRRAILSPGRRRPPCRPGRGRRR
jgi:DNA-directed RNA polymerase specialized sigma24 family protein